MSAPADAAESSRARQQPEEPSDEAPQRRRWVALCTITGRPHRPGDERHRRDLLLDLHDPPRASTLVLRANLTSFFPIILVADSSSARLLVKAAWGSARINRPEYFLCDARARTAQRLPAVPSSELGGPDACPLGGLDLCPRRSNGLIADPDRTGHFMIAQLHPAPATRHGFILFYSTATRRWATKQLASAPEHKRWGAHGVLAHDGLLWWVDVAYGMVVCNPFDDAPHLRLVPLPEGCALQGVEVERNNFHGWQRTREFLDQRRFIRPSEGKLRYVEILGFNYDTAAAAAEPPNDPTVRMWTLVDQAGPNPTNTWAGVGVRGALRRDLGPRQLRRRRPAAGQGAQPRPRRPRQPRRRILLPRHAALRLGRAREAGRGLRRMRHRRCSDRHGGGWIPILPLRRGLGAART
ncbi:hypothetical protein PVAP13_5NG021200 [Panicum virgatum]|uniref:DUF1618 domain-containing protein n=1 Tax=Panicum virgatum TaxID=38727 RepID=A0A8T0RJ86_PANVG|nr:hypothetical protein PVAP13_5NG021200 [Panicum virgatum]